MTALKTLLSTAALVGGLALATGACGKVGALEAPGRQTATVPPSADTAPPTITRRGADPLPAGLTESGAVRSSDGSTDPDENAPRTKRDIRDPNTRLTPLPVQPVDGAKTSPFGPPVSTQPPG